LEEWEKSNERALKGGYVRGSKDLPKGSNGRNLCRWCELEVPKGRQTFCSNFCVEQWRLRTDPGFLRDRTFERDRGICAFCSTDTVSAYADLRRSRGIARLHKLQFWGLKSVNQRKTLWDADHIIPVVEGGGACDLFNIRTLCLICHRKITAELRARLSS